MQSQQNVREQLLNYLTGRHAHVGFDDALNGFPIKLINDKPANTPYTFWELLEHIRRTQNDIVDFIQNSDYKDKSWPEDYWPAKNKKADKKAWAKSVAGFKRDFASLVKIVKNPKTDLLAKIPHGQGQTIFREAILVIDHNAYHIGEFILMRRIMGEWKK